MKSHLSDEFTLFFNPKSPTIAHIDINSCFATIEQQANPLLRNKPIVVAAYAKNKGVILASSKEAKVLGIKTGMRVEEGKKIFKNLCVLEPDANKYRAVHRSLSELFSDYTNTLVPKSIDEFVLDLKDFTEANKRSLLEAALEIKRRIKKEVGDWITVSIGFGPSRFIAKTASNFKKPDGLTIIDHTNVETIYSKMDLLAIHGINVRNKARLNKVGIYTVIDFYNASLPWLKAAFASVAGYYWYVRLRGWDVDTVEFERRSFGNQYAMQFSGNHKDLYPILQKLVEKTGSRMRKKGFKARGIHVSLAFADGDYWHMGRKLKRTLFDSRDIYQEMVHLLTFCPELKPVRILSESVFDLVIESHNQLELFSDIPKKLQLVRSVDIINESLGNFSITPARMITARSKVPDRIAFGGVEEL